MSVFELHRDPQITVERWTSMLPWIPHRLRNEYGIPHDWKGYVAWYRRMFSDEIVYEMRAHRTADYKKPDRTWIELWIEDNDAVTILKLKYGGLTLEEFIAALIENARNKAA